MAIRTGGTLGDASVTDRARGEAPNLHGCKLSPEEEAAYIAVRHYQKANPTIYDWTACKKLSIDYNLFRAARRKAEENKPDFKFSSGDAIRPGDKILEVARREAPEPEEVSVPSATAYRLVADLNRLAEINQEFAGVGSTPGYRQKRPRKPREEKPVDQEPEETPPLPEEPPPEEGTPQPELVTVYVIKGIVGDVAELLERIF